MNFVFLLLSIVTWVAHCLHGSQKKKKKPLLIFTYIFLKITRLWLWLSCTLNVVVIHLKTQLQKYTEKKRDLAELTMLRVTKRLKEVTASKKTSVCFRTKFICHEFQCGLLPARQDTSLFSASLCCASEKNCQHHCRGYCNIFVHTYLDK